MLGYLLGNIFLLTVNFLAGKLLAMFIPEWLLGILGILPIHLALRTDQANVTQRKSSIFSVLITYLSVYSGCNLSIFLPSFIGKNFS
ncbi:hypothetical protein [Liquorilactobacillus vini]|uniref:Uncharacterized protein n=1 Tax=Liquorilactobacillus vini DSM 20605 TaxID=1133569 RepID=A0A0R2C8D5_9LACO|nr:hypothetical protein [Liquorilactobacillus vini]KRM84284.1 hypothetical protein FD21_GL002059 [Liquorilactobacillus vini DSM 20605]